MGIKKNLYAIIFWGACWGIIEATFGNFLHVINLNVGWLLWFPIAFFFMYKVYKLTGKQEAILILCIITAGIKLLDLFMPVRIDKVINPAVSIILEGLAVFVVIQVMNKSQKLFKPRLLSLAATCFTWKILYSIYVLFLPNWMFIISPLREFSSFL
ncbi:MAG: hypothetical protein PHZ11_08805, partial [Desulfitobacteriaceae bacterium]|nr:hypothetical protein [Desulfitobacteriaceae bacterium]MDD4346962.1 hypothetical protein [Desulfitobacteriaceae bacterium]